MANYDRTGQNRKGQEAFSRIPSKRSSHRCVRSYKVENGKVVEVTGPQELRASVDLARSTVHGFTSHQMRTWHPSAPRHDSEGQAVFHSMREVREFEARAKGDLGEEWHYNEV